MTALVVFLGDPVGRVATIALVLAMVLSLLSVSVGGPVAAQESGDPEESDESDDSEEAPEAPPPALVGSDFDRVAGSHRIATAVSVSRDLHPVAETVLLARADDYADALSAAPLARRLDGPILLTDSDALHEDVAAEIVRLGASQAVLLGGTAALSEAVQQQVAELVDEVDRLAGSSRFGTARRVANRLGGTEVYLAEGANPDPGRGWPDALAVSALAGLREVPVLLTVRDQLPGETAAALDELNAAGATIVGGTAAVSQTVEDELDARGLDVTRLAGPTRYHTAMRVLEASEAAGLSAARPWFVTGRNFPDSLVAGPAAARHGGVLVLLDGQTLDGSPQVRDWVDGHSETITHLRLVGGPAAISEPVADEIFERLGAPPAPTFSVDETLEPGDHPDIEVPLGAVASEEAQADFAVDHIVLDGTRSEAEAVAARWGGEVLVVNEAEGALGLYAITVDVSRAEQPDPDVLAARIKAIDPLAFGDHRVSDETALRLLAILVEEHERGHMVSLDVLGNLAGIPERTTTEASDGPSGYTDDAYAWPQLQDGGNHDTGIAEVWSRMHFTGTLEPRSVRVAVIDGGFDTDHDRWAPIADTAIAPGIPFGPVRSFGDPWVESGKRWHGTWVTSVLAAAVDDGAGAAGPAGPVAELVLVDMGQNIMTGARQALGMVQGRDVDIANISWSVRLPKGVHWTGKPLKRTIRATTARGTIVVASAGNSDNDVDSKKCFIKCWENDLVLPCEQDPVICVGGTDTDGSSKHPSSNYSGGRGDNDVAIYAPYNTWTGPDPNSTDSAVKSVGGTSFSSPLVAGSLALLLNAAPSRSFLLLRLWLLQGTRTGTGVVDRILDLNRSFDLFLGPNEPPEITITAPEHGEHIPEGRTVSLDAEVVDEGEAAVTWRLDGAEVTPPLDGLSAGTYTLEATATDDIGLTDSDTVMFTVDPRDWNVSIDRPVDDPHEVVRGHTFPAEGSALDPATGDRPNPDRLRWRIIETAETLGFGEEITVDTTDLEPGDYRLWLALLDESDGSVLAEDFITVRVQAASDDDAPSVIIQSPESDSYLVEGSDDEGSYVDLRLLAEVNDDHDTIADDDVDWSATWETVGESGTTTIPSGNDFTHRFYHKGGCTTNYTLTASVEDSASNVGDDTIEFSITTLC